MSDSTNKERLQTLLDGGIPDVPPTWELVFQIQEEFFGMPPRSDVRSATYGSDEERTRALWHYDFEVYERSLGGLEFLLPRLQREMLHAACEGAQALAAAPGTQFLFSSQVVPCGQALSSSVQSCRQTKLPS